MREQDGKVYVIDVNANCDITATGGFARSARIAGFDYGAAASHIVQIAAARRLDEREAAERAYQHELTQVYEHDMAALTAG